MLRAVGDNHLNADARDRLPREPLTGFIGRKGRKATGELVIIGRAVNGWDEEWYPEDVCEQEARRKIVERLFAPECPMSWLMRAWGVRDTGEYNARRSAFWRVSKSVVGQLGIADVESDSWASLIAWTNLYKLSPFCGGNPSERLCRLQRTFCEDLLKEELNEWQPKRTLMLTGTEWAKDFLRPPDADFTEMPEMKFVQAVGTIRYPGCANPSQLVVAKHPQGEPLEPFVEELRSVFS